MSQVRFTEATTLAPIVTTELNSLADNAAAVDSDILSNDASTERNTLANFCVVIATQGGARDASAQVSLLIVPEGYSASAYTDAVAALKNANDYIAKRADGSAVTWTLDAATTARELTAAGVQIPNCNYKVGLLNESGQALAASGNIIYKSGDYSQTYVA